MTYPVNQKVEVKNQVDILPSWTKTSSLSSVGGGETTHNVSAYNSLICEIKITGNYGIMIRGETKNNAVSSRYLPALDEKRFLHPFHLKKTGRYYIDLSGIDTISIVGHPKREAFEAQFTFSTMPAPEPLDVPVRYKRITPEDGLVVGDFRAIEPLTDIQLSSTTRYTESSLNEASETKNTGFLDSDIRLAGQPLFGPFERVQITQGVALLVLL